VIPRIIAAAALLVSGFACGASELALEPSRIARAPVKYQSEAQLAAHPVPVVSARREGLSAGASEIREIKDKVIYPLIARSPTAVAAIVLEWHPHLPEQLGILVIWSNGDSREAAIPRTRTGHYDASAYEALLARPTP
jgi:hypothetical protein